MDVSNSLRAVDSALARGDEQAAAMLAQAAVRAGASHPRLCRLAALAFERAGALGEAIGILRKGLEQAPRDAGLLTALGLYLKRSGRGREAERALRSAVMADPNAAEAHYGLGDMAAEAGLADAAQTCFERAIEADPAHAEALAALATLLARTGRPGAAQPYAERALARLHGHPVATTALATVEIAEHRAAEAEVRLQRLLMGPGLTRTVRAAAYGLLGDARHALGRPAEAFRAYSTAAAGLRELHRSSLELSARAFQVRIDSLRRLVEATSEKAWARAPAESAGPARAHVFLVGFPRSGTTLLEQVLAAHPDVVTLEEKPTLADPEQRYLAQPESLEALLGIEPARAARCRREYWERVRGYGVDPTGKVFVDKLPMNLINLPLIARLFPGAKVLLAVRDPRDVVLSAFRRSFAMNAAMYALLTPQGAAESYDRVMGLAQACRDKLGLDLHEVRYERLVCDFEAETTALCGFLGVAWSDVMGHFASIAQARTINTPSAGQVRSGLYRHGVGQWRAYRDQLAPVLPLLEPWVERWGYQPSQA